ncbi:hypothetical protein MP228_002354 [Amoeboaphelidium protococcarum]|nr:hypothetical protein MP228_002354 [Amoeboaphelidium protococcarum]
MLRLTRRQQSNQAAYSAKNLAGAASQQSSKKGFQRTKQRKHQQQLEKASQKPVPNQQLKVMEVDAHPIDTTAPYQYLKSSSGYTYRDHLTLLNPEKCRSEKLRSMLPQVMKSTDHQGYLQSMLDALNMNPQYSLKDKVETLELACDFFIKNQGGKAIDYQFEALKGTPQQKMTRI